MSPTQCIGWICFVALDRDTPRFFGFAEFLAALALMVLAWTIADVRYQFRVRTAPLPLHKATFITVAAIGTLSLATDLWRAEQWLVPQGQLLTPALWQALLGFVLFLTFLTWAWFAFIRPPVYGRANARRYARTLYRSILKGSPAELGVIADELAFSAESIVRYAADRPSQAHPSTSEGAKPEKERTAVAVANDILLLIADRRLCRAIVESSPGTALAVFSAIGDTKKYHIPVHTFARNIVNEALTNTNSFLYHETEGYETGLMGYHKPLSQAMFADYRMVEAIGDLLDADFRLRRTWTATQWDAYCRVVLITFRDYVERHLGGHSFTLYRALADIGEAVSELYRLNGIADAAWSADGLDRLRVVVQFIEDAIKILNQIGVPEHVPIRVHKTDFSRETIYDHLAKMIAEVVYHASGVRSPVDLCWWVQHNAVWGRLFNFDKSEGPAAQVIQFKVRRLIYDEVVSLTDFPNFKSARVLGFCLNVMGLDLKQEDYFRDSRALQRVILSWTRRHYAWLYDFNPRVAEACLVDGMTFDREHLRLVRTYPVEGLRREPHHVVLEVDLPATQEAGSSSSESPPPAPLRRTGSGGHQTKL